MMFHNFAYGIGGWGMLAMMLIWAALIVALVWLVSSLVLQGQRQTDPSSREILEQRYARGDLSREEYQQMQTDLGNK